MALVRFRIAAEKPPFFVLNPPETVPFWPGWMTHGPAGSVPYWRHSPLHVFEGSLPFRPMRRQKMTGWSLGALTLLQACAEGKAAAEELILIAPPFFLGGTDADAFRRQFRANPARMLRRFAEMIASGHAPEDARALRLRFIVEFERMTPRGLRFADAWLRYLHGFNAETLKRHAGRMPKKISFLFGAGDRITPVSDAAKWQALFPRAEVTILPRQGHAPHLSDAPLAMAAFQKAAGLG